MSEGFQREAGFALILALWAAFVLAAILSLIVKSGRTDAGIAKNEMLQAQRHALAEGVLHIVEMGLLQPPSAGHIPLDGFPTSVVYAGRSYRVIAQDQAGLIDLNFATADSLNRLFTVGAGLDQMTADTLTDRIMDWREKGAGRRLNGAKAKDYDQSGYAYGPREASFESVDELRLVMGMTGGIYRAVAPALTVYAQRSFVYPAVAGSLVLSTQLGMTADSAAAEISLRQNLHESGNDKQLDQLPLQGRCIRISVSEIGADRSPVAARAIIRLTGDFGKPIWVYTSE
jgi:hypothetical protein